MRLKLTTIIALLALIFSTSCKKDEYVNLSASISGENSYVGTTEGVPLVYDISLSKDLSEDLTIKLAIDTTQTAKYINKDDYNPIFEYSSDSGRTWRKGTASSVTFPKRTKDLKIRLHTLDDKKLEVHEEFILNFTADTGNKFNISGSIPPVESIVEDNEINKIEVHDGIATYVLDNNNNFNLIAINREKISDKDQKNIIDNGLKQEVKDDIVGVTSLGNIGIKYLEVLFDFDSGLQGFVANVSNTSDDQWYMGLQLSRAYYTTDPVTRMKTPQKYNENGFFGYVLTHEFGHIMTLNRAKEIDVLISENDCNRLYIREGCAREASALHKFNTNFYDGSTLNEPSHVTNYAKTNIVEDIAESFAFYVTQDDTPKSTDDSSGALRKMNFVANFMSLNEFRTPIREATNVKLPSNSSEIRAYFNRTKEGKHISCTDHVRIAQVVKEGFSTN